MAAAAASPRRFGLPLTAISQASSATSSARLGDQERDVGRARERLADQRVAHLGLEVLGHPHRREDVLVGDRVLGGERRRAMAERLGLGNGARRSVPVVGEAGSHGRE